MQRVFRRIGRTGLVFVASAAMFTPGCARSWPAWAPGGWETGYESAEKSARASGRSMLIYFKDSRMAFRDPIEAALRTRPLSGSTRDLVRCVLLKSYEPDRRYVAQFGVERAPALILVHPDGTYHSQVGPRSTDDIRGFLAAAKPPGATPRADPFLPRAPEYRWETSVETALAQAGEAQRMAVIVYYRTWSRDWAGFERLLATYEVFRRLDSFVHCRVGVGGINRERFSTPFGDVRLPAMIIARSDGRSFAAEMPTSSEWVVRFLDDAIRAFGSSSVNDATAGAESVPSERLAPTAVP